MGCTVLRSWLGRVPSARAEEYLEYQMEVGPPGYRAHPGCAEIHVLGRELDELYEVGMLTLWDSLEAVRAFAGDPVEKAHYYARDRGFLVDPPDEVEHFEVAARTDDPMGAEEDRARVVRVWRARVPTEQLARALERETALAFPDFSALPGHRGACLATRHLGMQRELALVSFWSSRAAVRAFAGSPIERAVYSGDLDHLLAPPEGVHHFDLLHTEAR